MVTYTLFYIRTSKSGTEAQLFLISTLIMTLLRGVGQLFSVKHDHKRPIYNLLKTVSTIEARCSYKIVLIPKQSVYVSVIETSWHTRQLILHLN